MKKEYKRRKNGAFRRRLWLESVEDARYTLLLHQLILEDFCLSKRRNTASEILDRR